MNTSETVYYIRWQIRRDMPEVLEIEKNSFDSPWSENDFIHCLRQRNCIGMVATHDDVIVGYMIYELHKTKLHVMNLAVHPDWRYKGVGQALVDKLTSKLAKGRRTSLTLAVRETNLDAQLFFKATGFQAVSVLRNFYDDCNEDAYLMEYSIDDYCPTNRISKYFEEIIND